MSQSGEIAGAGAAPILEHLEFLDLRLHHNVNCLMLHGSHELAQAFKAASQLSPIEITRPRDSAFARRLPDRPHPRVDLLLNACRAPGPQLRAADLG